MLSAQPHQPYRSAWTSSKPIGGKPKRKKFKMKTRSMIRAERRHSLHKLIADVILERVPGEQKERIIREAKRRQRNEELRNAQKRREAEARKKQQPH